MCIYKHIHQPNQLYNDYPRPWAFLPTYTAPSVWVNPAITTPTGSGSPLLIGLHSTSATVRSEAIRHIQVA